MSPSELGFIIKMFFKLSDIIKKVQRLKCKMQNYILKCKTFLKFLIFDLSF